jgi:signal transduction histidine kinase
MRLAEFLIRNMDAIIKEWEAFAISLFPPERQMSQLALRDHVREIMQAVAADISTSQTRHEQAEKSKGKAPKILNAPETAAQSHAVLRAQEGLDINELAAEYRALRASVLRLWCEASANDPNALQDAIRFSEAIDQALAESIEFFSKRVELSRNLFLGSLGHDMRSPLQAILLTARSLPGMNSDAELSEAAGCLGRCGASMQALLNDLVDFSRAHLGVGLNLVVREVDLATIFRDELQQQLAAHPGRRFDLEVHGDVSGNWDGRRVQQVLRNLVSNAVNYGSEDQPVRVDFRGEEKSVVFEVANAGPQIDPAMCARIFEPLLRGTEEKTENARLGLGLYIVREITEAHGGTVEVRSDAKETAFTVRLPR